MNAGTGNGYAFTAILTGAAILLLGYMTGSASILYG